MLRSLLPVARSCRYCQRTAIRSYAAAAAPAAEQPASKITHSPSMLKAGTVMKDLSVLKDKPDPVALPDEEYPSWLWTLTDEYVASSKSRQEQAGSEEAAVFDMKAEKKKLRAKNRAEIKSRNFLRTT